MIVVRAVAALVVLWLIGALALACIGARRPGGPGVAADFAAGTAILAFVGSVAVVAGARVSVLPFYGLAAVLAAAVWRRRPGLRISGAWPRDRIALTLLAVAGASLASLFVSSLGDRLWWDGWVIWALKARVLFLEGTLPPGFLDPEGAYAFAHPGYPLALPLVNWWLYRHAGAAAPALASLCGTVWLALLPLVLWGALRERTGERVAALAAAGTVTFWPLAVNAAGGTADVVVALALLGAVGELDRGLSRADPGAFVRCGVYLSLGAMAKMEGLVLALAAAVVGIGSLVRRGERSVRAVLPFALPFILVAPWHGFAAARGLGRQFVSASLAPEVIGERILLVIGAFGDMALEPPWLPLVILAGIGVLRRTSAAGWFVLGGHIAALAVAYVLTPLDMIWLIETSSWRLLGACVPALLYLSLSGVAAASDPGAATGDRASRSRDRGSVRQEGGVRAART
ncbi:MAG TPA: glycosyltransferase family 39 protein [Longimicrobiales bacterium]